MTKRIEYDDYGNRRVTHLQPRSLTDLEQLAAMNTDKIQSEQREPPDFLNQHAEDSEMQALMNRANRAMKMKAAMLRKDLIRAHYKCDDSNCKGHWRGYLPPHHVKRTIRIHCDGICGFMFME